MCLNGPSCVNFDVIMGDIYPFKVIQDVRSFFSVLLGQPIKYIRIMDINNNVPAFILHMIHSHVRYRIRL